MQSDQKTRRFAGANAFFVSGRTIFVLPSLQRIPYNRYVNQVRIPKLGILVQLFVEQVDCKNQLLLVEYRITIFSVSSIVYTPQKNFILSNCLMMIHSLKELIADLLAHMPFFLLVEAQYFMFCFVRSHKKKNQGQEGVATFL
ncbi:hypothetical protein M9H77_05411 [Catharanthus roseus]|uniref:Uncharacterized protein n=1 Tax=Catharanthus roseus TaxID=4058 RepID=A0ACC0CH94_CATRO|nr:hypothetical protein M9H77_05411 [Catharanthus roseus]